VPLILISLSLSKGVDYMDGQEINERLERGLMGSYDIRLLVANPDWMNLGWPSDPNFAQGAVNSVTQQSHRIDAEWNDHDRSLTIIRTNSQNSPGLWIPWLGQGFATLAGVNQMQNRGLGTYTPGIDPGGPISWVATGPFSGCYSVAFRPNAGNVVFAHVITPTEGYTADLPIGNQINNIAAQVGAPGAILNSIQKVTSANAHGFVFWTLLDGLWWRRVVWMLNRQVKAVDQRTQV
jgi:hypothetical protein